MIRIARLVFALFATVAVGAAELPPITNGGFEEGTADWEIVGGQIVEDLVHSGTHSLQIVHTPERKLSLLNRFWEGRSGKQGALVPVLKGEISYWYRVESATNAKIWLGVIPMSADPWENTGCPRTGTVVPANQVGDGRWHQVTVSYDYSGSGAVKWVHVSCFITGEAADVRLDDIEWVRTGIGVASLDLSQGADGTLVAQAVVANAGNTLLPGAVGELVLPESLALAPGEDAVKTLYPDLPGGTTGKHPLAWRLTGSLAAGKSLGVTVRSRGCAAAAERDLSPEGCTGDLRAIPATWVAQTQRPAPVEAPPTPAWFKNAVRIAYTDLGNISRGGEWPDKLIADLGKSGVQVFYSRAHSGEGWPGVGWRSVFSEPAMGKGVPDDWTGVGVSLCTDDAHVGKNSIRVEHDGRKESYLLRRWAGNSGKQGAMLDTLKGTISFWYKAVRQEDASIWLGVLPMSADPLENTGTARAGMTVPADQVGDGQWHQAIVPFDFTGKEKVKWIQVACFIYGTSAEVLLDDIELLVAEPQPLTNGGFEQVGDNLDPTRRVADLCHQNGIRYLAYFWGMREPMDVWRDHPDWKCVGRDGQPRDRFCPNIPGYRQFMKDRFAEIIKTCGVDGIFIDMHNIDYAEGYCEHCVRQFRELTGENPPTVADEEFDSPLWQAWVRFKYQTVEDAMLDYNRAIKAVNPEAVLVSNSWSAWTYRRAGGGPKGGTSIRLAEVTDGLLEELGWYDLDSSLFAFPARFNFMSWHLGGLSKEKPAHAWGHPTEWAGGGTTQSTEARIRVMTMITNGSVAAQTIPAREVMAEYMDDLAEREPYLRDSHLFPWCGMVVSEKTEQWYGRDDPVNRYLKGVYGAFQMMLESHLPVSLVTDRELELGAPENYRVLFLPNCAVMSGPELATVREFVRNGGGVVATYETSRYDEHGWPRENLGLADVFGVGGVLGTFDNRSAAHLRPPTGQSALLQMASNHPWSSDPVILGRMARVGSTSPAGALDRSLPIHCQILEVASEHGTLPLRTATWAPQATTEGQTAAQKRRAASTTQSADYPGIIETTYGKGKVVYIPADLSWAFFRYGHDFLGRFLELAVRQAAAEPPPAEVEAPAVVQTMTHQQDHRLVVHLLNDISSFGRSQIVVGESLYIRREVLPIHDIRVTFRDTTLKHFRLVPGDTELVPTQGENGLTVTVPRLDIHAMVVAE